MGTHRATGMQNTTAGTSKGKGMVRGRKEGKNTGKTGTGRNMVRVAVTARTMMRRVTVGAQIQLGARVKPDDPRLGAPSSML